MRETRTKEETWAIDLLLGKLEQSESWSEDTNFVDAPDLVIENEAGIRVAVEVTGVSINEWHQLKNDPRKQLEADELDSLVLPREADIWVTNTISSKNLKIETYLKNSKSIEAWLLVHGGIMSPYDFFILDEAEGYDLPLMQDAASSITHEFDRIYIASSSSNVPVVQIFPPINEWPTAPDLSKPNTMKALEVRSMKTNGLDGGVRTFRLGQEFTPDRQIILKPLDRSRG